MTRSVELSAPEGLLLVEQLEYWRGLAHEQHAMLKRVLGSKWTADDVRVLIDKAEGR